MCVADNAGQYSAGLGAKRSRDAGVGDLAYTHSPPREEEWWGHWELINLGGTTLDELGALTIAASTQRKFRLTACCCHCFFAACLQLPFTCFAFASILTFVRGPLPSVGVIL